MAFDQPAAVSMRIAARKAWELTDPGAKSQAVTAIGLDLGILTRPDELAPQQEASIEPGAVLEPAQMAAIGLDALEPGRPDNPLLVHPAKVSRRRSGSAKGRMALLHAIAHIEFNAINLALDAIWRYPQMPIGFAFDWWTVAHDECRHFHLITDELALDGHHYGDLTAHQGLWEMARKTADDFIARMALVPRVLEARGLDATPLIQARLNRAGDQRAVDILQIILDEEIRHVALGDAWYKAACHATGQDPEKTFRQTLEGFNAPWPRRPMNRDARSQAGFSDSELDWLDSGPVKNPSA